MPSLEKLLTELFIAIRKARNLDLFYRIKQVLKSLKGFLKACILNHDEHTIVKKNPRTTFVPSTTMQVELPLNLIRIRIFYLMCQWSLKLTKFKFHFVLLLFGISPIINVYLVLPRSRDNMVFRKPNVAQKHRKISKVGSPTKKI